MTLVFAWVLVPLLFYALAFGCGSLLERITGIRLPGALVPPTRFALVIVIASLTTMNAHTADLTTPLVVALAVVGVGLAFPFDRRPDTLAAGTAAAVFLVYAAPIVLSGSATFAGHLARRHCNLARVRRQRTRARTKPGRDCAVNVLGRPARQPAGGLSDRIDGAVRHRAPDHPPGHGLAVSAIRRLRLQPAVALDLRARPAADRQPSPTSIGRVLRCPAGAPVRVRVLERHQGGHGRLSGRSCRCARCVRTEAEVESQRADSARGRRSRAACLLERARRGLAGRTLALRRSHRRRLRCEAGGALARDRDRCRSCARVAGACERVRVRPQRERKRLRARHTRQPLPPARRASDIRNLARRRLPRPALVDDVHLRASRRARSYSRVRNLEGGEGEDMGSCDLCARRGLRLGGRPVVRQARPRIAAARRESLRVGVAGASRRRSRRVSTPCLVQIPDRSCHACVARVRRVVVERACVRERVACPAGPAGRARDDRETVRRRRTDADDRIPAVWGAPLPAGDGGGGGVRAACPPGQSSQRRRSRQGAVRRSRRVRPELRPVLPDTRAAHVAAREPSSVLVCAGVERPLVRGVAAAACSPASPSTICRSATSATRRELLAAATFSASGPLPPDGAGCSLPPSGRSPRSCR